ncbi:DUF1569 domain-containing protein [Gimesia fumaroli]|uniref:DUF1569 domain-containing protein n=1 Tax=Gimesia fumaroli TaxID=2527976 RepID=A0A518IGC4_9PLAN|nr:DUF1569 domain-containing protein [Gimesia fumaroli]QDV52134.1 hypothetical protein Enr17x_41940 [Gimesia fumaroli]
MVDNTERRKLEFRNLDEILAEVEKLASEDVRTTGNHTFGEILNHLALSLDVATGRVQGPPPPLFMRLIMPLMKRMVINSKPLKPGIKLPAKGEAFFWPDKEFDVPATVDYFKEAVNYYKVNGPIEKHPFFGKISKADCDELNCRHAALHLSFVHPV